jgi:hypothetical protein
MGKEEFVGQTSWILINSLKESTHILLRQEKKLVSNYIIFIHVKYYYSHSCKDNNSKHDRSCLHVLLDMSLFIMVTSQNGKMKRNRSIGTTSVRVLIPII